MADPDDELELEVDTPAETDLEDEGLDTAEQGEESQDQPEDQLPVAAQEQERLPERQPTRGENRFQVLQNRNVELETRLSETTRRLDELTRRVELPRQQGETPEQRAARFALMTPQEQIAETLRDSEQRHTASLNAMQLQMRDTADRTAFQSRAAVDPLYAKWAPKVEGKLAELRTKGQDVEREVLLKFLIGEAALERRSSKEGRTEVRAAQRRVQSQRTRPVSSGSDTQSQRRSGSSVERRLENVQI